MDFAHWNRCIREAAYEARRSFGLRSLSWILRAFEIARQRRALLRLDDAALKDVALSRADAYREGTRAWWDLPHGPHDPTR